jgi:hypothetical protein
MQITLHNGVQVDSYSEAWRNEAEAKTVLRMPSKSARQEYLQRVRKSRGETAGKFLEKTILSIWESRKSNN